MEEFQASDGEWDYGSAAEECPEEALVPMVVAASGDADEPLPSEPVRIDLTRLFSTSFRYSIRRSWISISLFFLVLGVFFVSEWTSVGHVGHYQGSMLHQAEKLLVWIHGGFVTLELAFWEFYRRRVRYFIRDGRFHIRRGVLRRLESSAPLSAVTEFFISQTTFDAVLGLHSLLILTPLAPANGFPRFTRIDGLSNHSAEGLLQWLARYVASPDSTYPPAGR